MLTGRNWRFVFLAIFSFFVLGTIRADELIPPLRRAVILSRVICYIAGNDVRGSGPLTVAVLSKTKDSTSATEASAMFSAFQEVADSAKMNDLHLKVIRLDNADPVTLASSLAKSGATAVYVCSGFESGIEAIKHATQQMKILTMAGQAGPVRMGLSVGVYIKEGKSSIIVNLASSQAEGAAFPPEFLRLAEIVK